MQAEPASTPMNGVDTGKPREEAPKAPPLRNVRSDLRHADRAHSSRRAVPRRRFTVAFYCLSSEPNSLPSFPYAVAGTVLGHTKFLAFMEAEDPTQAAYNVSAYFDVAQVESVDDGWRAMPDAPLRGTVATPTPRSFLARLFGL